MQTRKIALITGASSGIGTEFARLLAADGFDLVLVARSMDRMMDLANELQQAHKIKCHVIEKDLSRPHAAREVYEELKKKTLMPQILINNAGSGLNGEFMHLDLQRQLQMMQLNMNALVELTHLCLPTMLAHKEGGILNVASTAAFQAGPSMAIYYATKAFVLSFGEALHEELREKGIRVSTLCPGPTDTGFVKAAAMQESRLFKTAAMSAADVARAGLHGLRYNCAIVIPGALNKTGAWSTKFLPRLLGRRIAGYLNTSA